MRTLQRVVTLSALFLLSNASNAVDVTLPTPPAGGRNELRCEVLTSTLLTQKPGSFWGGLPTWTAVKGGSVVHTCPPEAGEHLQIPREYYRNYQLTLRWTVYDAENNIVSSKLLPPYYLWGGVPPATTAPQPPILELLARVRRALWGA